MKQYEFVSSLGSLLCHMPCHTEKEEARTDVTLVEESYSNDEGHMTKVLRSDANLDRCTQVKVLQGSVAVQDCTRSTVYLKVVAPHMSAEMGS